MKLPGQLVRNAYLREHDRGTAGDPNSSSFDPAGLTRTDPAAFEQLAVDLEQYHRTIESLHGIAAHGAGIGYGLQVSATRDQPDIRIAPGIAIDALGRHIHLAQGLRAAEISPRADNPLTPVRPADVTAAGVTLPTASFAGDFLVTIQRWETFDENTSAGSDGRNQQFRHTPWLRLIKPEQRDPDNQVVLAKVTLDGDSKVKDLTPGDGSVARREAASVPAQRIRLKRGVALDGPSVDTVPSGEVRARDGGGLQLSVADPADQIEFMQGDNGRFAQMVVNAKEVKFGTAVNPSLVVDTGSGRIVLRDQQGGDALRLDAATSSVALKRLDGIAGSITVAGALQPIAGQPIKLAGDVELGGGLRPASGGSAVNVMSDLVVNGKLRGATGQALGIAGDVAVGGTLFDSRGVPLAGNPARKVRIQAWTVNAGERATFDINLGSPRQFTALCIPAFSQTVGNNFEVSFAVEVYVVDGAPVPPFAQGGGSLPDVRYAPPCVTGVGRIITFRVSALGRAQYVGAVGIVFYE